MGSLRVLGTVEIRSGDGVPLLAAGATRTRRLLALLTLRAGQPVSVDTVADVVWGDDQPDHPAGSVQTLVSRLRRLVADESGLEMVTVAGGYLLRVEEDALDARRFEDLAARAAACLDDDPLAAAELLDQALALWTGDAYGELAAEEPFRAEAARLEELRATAVEDRAEAGLRLGRHHEAAARLEPLVAAEPLRERRRAQLILARHRAGRTAEALAAYQEYRDLLVEELGLEPSATLRALHEAVLRDDPQLAWRPAAAALAVRRAPAPGTRLGALVGRDTAVDEVSAVVGPGGVVTLTGPGGVGKSSLARAVAQRLAEDLPDGAHLVELAPVTAPSTVPHAVASALDVPASATADQLERVTRWLAPQQALLVLDNCEHLLDAVADLVDAVRRAAPGVSVLLTSQTPVGLPGEQLVAVAPLPVEGPDSGRPGPAMELFVARARAHDPSFALTPDNTEDVATVCRRLDGLPLALELAAARMRGMSPGELAARLSGRFRLLHGGSRTARDRHRTLRALVDWSYGLLDPGQRRAFEALSVFAGWFPLEHAERLLPAALPEDGLDAGAAADLVLTLVDRSMVVSRPGSPTTYQLLETLRAYGRERLQDRGAAEPAHAAHAHLMADVVGDTRHRLFGPTHAEDASLVARSLDEMRTAFTWCLAHDPATAARIVAGGTVLVEHRMSAEIPHWARTLLAGPLAGPAVPDEVPEDLVAWTYAVAAAGERFAGDLAEAERLAQQAAALGTDSHVRCYATYVRAEAAAFGGDLPRSREHLDEAMRLAPAAMPAGWQPLFGVMVALDVAYVEHDTAEASRMAEQAHVDARREGLAVPAAWALYGRGEVLLEDDPVAAGELLEQAVREAESLGDRYLIGVALLSLASARSRAGDTSEAVTLFRRTVAHWRRAGNWTHQWTTLRNAVVLLDRMHQPEDAAVLDGGIRAREASAQASGAEAVRMAQTRADLVVRLGEGGYDDAARVGAAMTEDELVDFVLDRLGRQPAQVSR